MRLDEAMELLARGVAGYLDDFNLELMREHYLAGKSHPHWIAIQSAFQVAMKQCSDTELNEFVEHEFNISCTSPQAGREMMSYIYNWVFEEQN